MNKATERELEIHASEDCLFAKGHHDFEAFKAAVTKEHYSLSAYGQPAHAWWRVVPGQPGDDYKSYWIVAKPNSRGACPVTVMERRS